MQAWSFRATPNEKALDLPSLGATPSWLAFMASLSTPETRIRAREASIFSSFESNSRYKQEFSVLPHKTCLVESISHRAGADNRRLCLGNRHHSQRLRSQHGKLAQRQMGERC